MDELLPFGSPSYLWMLGLLFFARGMDFFSTWVATPSLALEGNPIAKKLGWKWGGLFNIGLCFGFAFWPLPAIIIITTGLLVAAHNFHSAWLMRSMGEDAYRCWHAAQIQDTSLGLYMACLLGRTFLTGLVGAGLLISSPEGSIPFAIGLGIIGFATIVFVYTSLGVWRSRRSR